MPSLVHIVKSAVGLGFILALSFGLPASEGSASSKSAVSWQLDPVQVLRAEGTPDEEGHELRGPRRKAGAHEPPQAVIDWGCRKEHIHLGSHSLRRGAR